MDEQVTGSGECEFDYVISPDHLHYHLADESRIQAELAKWEADPARYISTQHGLLTTYDFPVYAAGNVKIKTKRGRLGALLFNRVQRQLWRWMLDDLKAGLPIRWFIIKARQMGISTWVLALFYWLTSQRPYRNALVLTHDEPSVQNFASNMSTLHASGHHLLRPETALINRDVIHFGTSNIKRKNSKAGSLDDTLDIGLDSKIMFQTADQPELARSYNLHYVLCSEYALWPNKGIDIKRAMVSLEQTVTEDPGTVIIKESTARGENEAKGEWDDDKNGYRKIFIPWVAFDEYRIELSADEHLDLERVEERGGAQTRYGDEVKESRLIRDALQAWKEPHEHWRNDPAWLDAEVLTRLKWRRHMIDTKCYGDKLKFREEYPTIPEHAFSSTSRNCFDSGSIGEMRDYVEQENLPIMRCTYIHDVEEGDPERKFQFSDHGKVYIYKPPDIDGSYVIGGDTSMGLSAASDPSALVVLAVPDLEEVASFNGVIPPEQLAEMAYYLGILYNTALLGLEYNEFGGAVANTFLAKTLRYPRLYYARDVFTQRRSPTPGFHTTDKNKSAMVAELAQAIRDHEIILRSFGLLDPKEGQLLHFQEHEDGTLGAPKGKKDDMVMATLIAVYLSTKVHKFPKPADPIKAGTFRAALRELEEKERRSLPSYF